MQYAGNFELYLYQTPEYVINLFLKLFPQGTNSQKFLGAFIKTALVEWTALILKRSEVLRFQIKLFSRWNSLDSVYILFKNNYNFVSGAAVNN